MPDAHQPLKGITVVVTRPESQGKSLYKRCQELGAYAISLPLIEIVFNDSNPLDRQVNNLEDYQKLIFISQNAVDAAFRIWPECQSILNDRKVFAVGQSTAKALQKAGVNEVISALDQGGSESLLQLDELANEAVQGQLFLIIRGQGGRELLKEQLEARGAIVDYADLYQRRRPCYDQAKISSVWQSGTDWQFFILTSVGALENLVTIMQAGFSEQLLAARLLTISERVAARARELGFKSDIVIANSTSDEGMIAALLKFIDEEK